jgi:quercetin dioxygenase-like cupin family protein
MPIRNLYELPKTLSQARGGLGECAGALAFTADELASSLTAVGMTVVPPGCSVGVHPHPDLEEVWIITAGTALATLDGTEQRVKPGDVLLNAPGGSHGLLNDGEDDVVFLAFAAKVAA